MSAFDHEPLVCAGNPCRLCSWSGFVGRLAAAPRVTSYLLAGVIVGPSLLDLVDHAELIRFEPIADLAMALVLFNLGSHFSLPLLSKIRAHICTSGDWRLVTHLELRVDWSLGVRSGFCPGTDAGLFGHGHCSCNNGIGPKRTAI